MTKLIKLSALSAVVVLAGGVLGGCASTSELNEVKAMAQAADQKATKALDSAQAAQACCNANSDKLNKMYQKSMSK